MPPGWKRGLWNEQQLEQAMAAMQEGMSVQKIWNPMPYIEKSLDNWLRMQQECELCAQIKRLSDLGMPITTTLLCLSVFTFCALQKIHHPFSMKVRLTVVQLNPSPSAKSFRRKRKPQCPHSCSRACRKAIDQAIPPMVLFVEGQRSNPDWNSNLPSVTLYCLPSNTTHALQPMDKAVFKQFESS
ncbi:hypothetical protein PR048_030247 [Dryococelus australis]|uniref:DDE-1 domain-containing protein n=1 Tax=Dryococelus australis TaxID=614101 RepID=A0ABQ9GBC8_9NEOP|nr:hypothetical protein PR048_030247 [Dryococelus australis]